MANKKATIVICPQCGSKNAILEGDEACVCRQCENPFVVEEETLESKPTVKKTAVSSKKKSNGNHDDKTNTKKKERTINENKKVSKDVSKNENNSHESKDSVSENAERLKESIIKSFCESTEKIKDSMNSNKDKVTETIKSKFEKNRIKIIAIGAGVILLFGVLIGALSSKEKDVADDLLVKAPKSSYSYAGTNYEDVYEQFLAAGFTNVTTTPEGDMILGIFNSEGEVDTVSIDGDSSYSTSTKYQPNAHVDIRYHSYPVNETYFDIYPIEEVPDEIVKAVVGTYVGDDGCGVTFFADGTCDFYYPNHDIESDQWTYGEGKLYCYTELCSCYISATISEDNAQIFDLVSDSMNWQDETYIKVLDTAEHIDAKRYNELYKKTEFKSSLALCRLNYIDVEKKLKKAGFSNITTKGTEDMLLGVLVSENQVKSVSLDGVTYFTDYSTFDKDTKIIITYYSYPPSNSTSSSSSKNDNNSKENSAKEDENTSGLQEYTLDYVFPMRSIVVAVTNYFADDNWLDGNTKDLSKNHTYSDLSGFYMIVKNYGQWETLTDEEGNEYYHCEHMILQGYNVTIPCNITSADVYHNVDDDSYTVKNIQGNIGEVQVGEILTYGQEFLTVTKELIDDNRQEATPEAEKRDAEKKQKEQEQESLRKEYSIQALMTRGYMEFNYCKWKAADEYATKNSDGSYFVKKAATVKNAYGQKVDVWMEGTARGSDVYDLYIEDFNVYLR